MKQTTIIETKKTTVSVKKLGTLVTINGNTVIADAARVFVKNGMRCFYFYYNRTPYLATQNTSGWYIGNDISQGVFKKISRRNKTFTSR